MLCCIFLQTSHSTYGLSGCLPFMTCMPIRARPDITEKGVDCTIRGPFTIVLPVEDPADRRLRHSQLVSDSALAPAFGSLYFP